MPDFKNQIMKILLDIKDNKAAFIMELLKNFKFLHSDFVNWNINLAGTDQYFFSLADQITNQLQNHPGNYKSLDFSNHVPACRLIGLRRVRCQGPGLSEQAQCHPFAM